MPKLINAVCRPKLTRFSTQLQPDGVSIIEQGYMAVMESPSCYWIVRADVDEGYLQQTLTKYAAGITKLPKHVHGSRIRRILKDAWGSYAHVDRDKAWRHFKGRQQTRWHKIQMQLSQVELALKFANDQDTAPSPQAATTEGEATAKYLLGHNDFTEHEIHWY